MRTQGRIRSLNSLKRRIESETRSEAEWQARKVPWPTLLEYRERYIKWEAFTLWVHAIEEEEHQTPDWLRRVVERRCAGIESEKSPKLWKCLDTWKHKTVFAKPNREGWMRAVSFFAARDLAYARNWAYWGHCERQWSVRRPASYPSFDEWKSAAESCPGEVLDSSGLRKERKAQIKAAARAGKERLERAVGIYLELEALPTGSARWWTRVCRFLAPCSRNSGSATPPSKCAAGGLGTKCGRVCGTRIYKKPRPGVGLMRLSTRPNSTRGERKLSITGCYTGLTIGPRAIRNCTLRSRTGAAKRRATNRRAVI